MVKILFSVMARAKNGITVGVQASIKMIFKNFLYLTPPSCARLVAFPSTAN